MNEWFYSQGREKCGPIPQAQLMDFIKSGVVTAGTPVWTRSMPEWLPAIQVPELLGSPPPVAPSPPLASPPPHTAVPLHTPAAPSPLITATPAAIPTATANPWDGEIDTTPPPSAEAATPSTSELNPHSNPPTAALRFNSRRPKLEHQRLGSKIKTLVARVAALIIAVGILGGGGYLGAEYLGIFEPDLDPGLHYLPDDPDFFFTIDIPKAMSIAESVTPAAASFLTDRRGAAFPIDPASLQNLTIAGNFGERRWILIATMAQGVDIMRFFPGGAQPDSIRAGGTKIYYRRDMANFGLDFAVAQPSKTTLLIGPIDSLKRVLKRRTAPDLPPAFQTLLDSGAPSTWAAGALDIKSLWRLADQFPDPLDSGHRELLSRLDNATFTLGGSATLQFELVARCAQPAAAEATAVAARQLLGEQRTGFLERLVRLGHPVGADSLELLRSVEIETSPAGSVTIRQGITREMLDELGQLLAATGLTDGI